MDLEVTPPVGDGERAALLAALERVDSGAEEPDPYHSAWRLAGLREGAEGTDDDGGYAFSPRSTRGATRA